MFVAEDLEYLEVVKLGLNLGFSKVIIEGDSLLVIKKKCSFHYQDKSEISAYIHSIKRDSYHFQILQFKHTKRLGNKVAHAIATECLKMGEEIYLYREIPRSH